MSEQITTWYEASSWGERIKPVRVLRETAHQIILADETPKNARRAKQGTYFRTWKEAHAYLIEEATAKRDRAAKQLAYAERSLSELNTMTEPTK